MNCPTWFRWILIAALLLWPGCDHEDPDDDDVTGDDDDNNGDDDDSTPELPPGCLEEPGPTPAVGICVEEAPCRWDGGSDGAKFGFDISTGGDFDGDGIDDFAVGAKSYTDFEEEGRVLLYPGTVATTDPMPAPGIFVGPQPLAFAGFSTALVPDMNGDGLDDLVVGATGVEDPLGVETSANVGAAYWIPGGPFPDADPDSGEILLVQETVFYGESYYARVGWDMSTAGDINGDGLGDLLLSGELVNYSAEDGETYRQGRAYVVLGREEGWADTVCLSEADVVLDGDLDTEMAGESLAGGHDLDGDDVPDLIIGAPYNYALGSYAGRVYVVSGADVAGGGSYELSDAAVALDGTATAYDVFGWSVGSPGDLTGDGLGEIVVGIPGTDGAGYNAGALMIYPGSTVLASGQAPEPLTTIHAEWAEHDMGIRAIGADVNGDGATDLLVSAIYAHQGFVGKTGRVYLFGHREEVAWGTVTSGLDADATYTGAGVLDYLGYGLAATDLNNDGADDLLLGAAYHDTDDGDDVGRVYMFWGGEF